MLYMYISENNTSKFNSRNIFVESIFKGLGVMCKMVSLTNPSYLYTPANTTSTNIKQDELLPVLGNFKEIFPINNRSG